MPATLNSLSPELLDLIIPYLSDERPDRFDTATDRGLASYATISRNWQYAVERYTFEIIESYSSDLSCLKEVVGASPRRRQHLKKLFYDIDLPVYSDNRRFCFERRREHQANLVAFRKGVKDLWDELASWCDGPNAAFSPRGISLDLGADAPMDRGREVASVMEEGLGEERWAYPEHSLTIHDVEGPPVVLPVLPCVTGLNVGTTGRRVHPAATRVILISLPNIRELNASIDPMKLKSRELRGEFRTSLARALEAPTLGKLESLWIHMSEYTPGNHNYQTAIREDPDFPDGDILSRAVCKLALLSLRSLHIMGSCPISPVLWGLDRKTEGGEQKIFPYLERLEVHFPLFTYDGRWYYTGDPTQDIDEDVDVDEGGRTPSEGFADSELDLDSDSCSSYNSEYPDSIYSEHERHLNGDAPYNAWRRQPDPDMFDPLIRGLASAALRMPRLQSLDVSTSNVRTGQNELGIAVEYLGPGVRRISTPRYRARDELLTKGRWIVSVGHAMSWELPEDIRALMEERLGVDGEIIINKDL